MESVPGSGRSPGGGNGNPLQYRCLGNPMDRGAWQATVYGDMTEHPCHPRISCTMVTTSFLDFLRAFLTFLEDRCSDLWQ